MGRLLDESVILDKFAEQCGEKSCDTCRFITKEKCASYIAIMETPTAFDVEEVVKELEKNAHWSESTYDEDGFYNDDSEEVIYLEKAIEVVRKGGVKATCEQEKNHTKITVS